MDQLQIYVNLLQLLNYQLKELLKIHIETYVSLNTAIYVHTMQNTKIEESEEEQALLFNDVDSESENETFIKPTTPITLNPYMKSSLNAESCFVKKPACIPKMYNILPNTKEKRDKKNKKLAEMQMQKQMQMQMQKQKLKLDNEKKPDKTKCNIM